MRYKKLLLFLALAAVLLTLNHRFGWSDYLGGENGLTLLQELVEDRLWLALLAYTAVTVAACVVLALPGVTFAVFAGILFGPWLGTLACLTATTLGAVAAFLAGRFFLRDAVRPMLEKSPLLRRLLFEQADKSDLLLLMITRLVPLFPYNLQNFAYGITDIRLGHYTLYTFVFMLPGVAMFTVGSAGLAAQEHRWLYFAVAALLLAVVTALGLLLRKKYLDGREKP